MTHVVQENTGPVIVKIKRSRGWAFTWNNFQDDDTMTHQKLQNVGDKIIFQEEISKSGTPHLQGYVYWKNPKSLKAARTAVKGKIHLEAARNDIAAAKYCEKLDDTTVNGGIKYSRGFKTKFEKAKNAEANKQGVTNPKIRRWCMKEFDKAIPTIVKNILEREKRLREGFQTDVETDNDSDWE